MDYGPLVAEQIDAGARFLREFDKYAPVRAALWLKDDDVRHWNLYVVSDEITDDNKQDAIGEVIRLAREMEDPYLNPLRVNLRGLDDRMAKAALDAHRLYRGRVPVRLWETFFGGINAEEIYMYPQPLPATAE